MNYQYPEIFQGDGRFLVEPTIVLPRVKPRAIKRSTARWLIDHFEDVGQSNHGPGATLWVILHYCHDQGVSYEMTAHPGLGYYVQKIKSL